MTKVLVASTMAAYKAMEGRDRRESEAWLTHADAWAAAGHQFFAALQTGQGHDGALVMIRKRLRELEGDFWTYSFDDGEESITSGGRLHAICMGRNLAHEYVNRHQDFTHLLLLDSDVEPPADCIDRLLEVRWPIVAGNIPTYCMDGPRLAYEPIGDGFFQLRGSSHELAGVATERKRFPDEADVREHWASAGCWMLTREAVNRIRWGWSLDGGATDDPWTADLAKRAGLGPMWVRHDVVCLHHPDRIGPVETRGHDLSITH